MESFNECLAIHLIQELFREGDCGGTQFLETNSIIIDVFFKCFFGEHLVNEANLSGFVRADFGPTSNQLKGAFFRDVAAQYCHDHCRYKADLHFGITKTR